MEQVVAHKPAPFVDRRQSLSASPSCRTERRQFQDSRASLPLEASELGEAIDQYKLCHRRRFITFEELFDVITSLGYHK